MVESLRLPAPRPEGPAAREAPPIASSLLSCVPHTQDRGTQDPGNEEGSTWVRRALPSPANIYRT